MSFMTGHRWADITPSDPGISLRQVFNAAFESSNQRLSLSYPSVWLLTSFKQFLEQYMIFRKALCETYMSHSYMTEVFDMCTDIPLP